MALSNNFFNSDFYLLQNPDVAAAVNQGLVSAEDHFNLYGKLEARAPNPFFDPVFYLAQNPDVAAALEGSDVSAFDHFMAYGFNEPRGIHPTINLGDYLTANPDVAAAVAAGQGSAFDHLLSYGLAEPRDLGNGVNLGAFANDPTFQAAIASGDLSGAAARVAEVVPFIPTFNAPAGWTPPANLPIPTTFVPVEGATLVIPAGVTVPAGTVLPDFIKPAAPVEPPVSDDVGGGGGGGGGDGGGSKPMEIKDLSKSITLEKTDPINATALEVTTAKTDVTLSNGFINVNLKNINTLKSVTAILNEESTDRQKIAFINVQNSVELGVNGDGSHEGGVYSDNVVLNYAESDKASLGTNQVINLNKTTAGNITVAMIEKDSANGARVESGLDTLTLNLTGENSIYRASILGELSEDNKSKDSILTNGVANTINIKGTGSLVMSSALADSVETVNAGDVVGAIKFTGGAGLKNVTTGKGNDDITMSAKTVSEATIDLGAGKNTLTVVKGAEDTDTPLKVNLTAAQDADITTVILDQSMGGLTVFNAGASTGGLYVHLDALQYNAGHDADTKLSLTNVTMGSGNDKIIVGGDTQHDVKVDLGTGNDHVYLHGWTTGAAITLGEGNDTVQIHTSLSNIKETENITDESLREQTIKITDFNTGTNVLKFAWPGATQDSTYDPNAIKPLAGNEVIIADINDSIKNMDSLLNAVTAVANITKSADGSGAWASFKYNNNTYIYNDVNGDGLNTGDGLLELTGYVGELNNSNFEVYPVG